MRYPTELKYSQDHEWVRFEGNLAVVGITDYAQSQLGDVVFVEFPEVGSTLSQHTQFGVVESVKTASELISPIGGIVIKTNGALAEHPELVNQDPYGDGWIMEIAPTAVNEVSSLLNAEQYQQLLPQD